jgi:GNAT superfamily N-acetyltransferase
MLTNSRLENSLLFLIAYKKVNGINNLRVKNAMSDIEIFFKKSVVNSPCMSMLLRGHSTLIDKGWATGIIPFGVKSSCVYAKCNKIVVGAIAFYHEVDNESVHIQLSYVDEAYRGRRIHQHMHNALQTHAKSLGALRITSTVHKDNAPLLQASTRTGMQTRWYSQIIELV